MKKGKHLVVFGVICLLFLSFIMRLARSGTPMEGGSTTRTAGVTLAVQVEGEGDFFEIGKNPEVSPSRDFAKPLQLQEGSMGESGELIFRFAAEEFKGNTVYVKLPILYRPESVDAVSVPLTEGATAKTGEGEDWFTLSDVEITGQSNGTYTVRVVTEFLSGDLIRVPKLLVDGKEFGAQTAGQTVTSGEFFFQVAALAESREAADAAVAAGAFVVEKALIKVDSESMTVSARDEGISVVVIDE